MEIYILWFAGSDISIIKEFKKHFGKSELMFLDKTFRFDNNISKVASQFIMKNESQKIFQKRKPIFQCLISVL